MPTYVSLINWTDQGIKNFRDTIRRAEDFRGLVKRTATLLQLGALGNVRTRTMKAFDAQQMTAIIQRTG